MRARVKRVPYALRSRTRGPIVIIPPAVAKISGGAPSCEMMSNRILYFGIEKAVKQRHEESLRNKTIKIIIILYSYLHLHLSCEITFRPPKKL